MDITTSASGDTGVAPSYGKNVDGSASSSLLGGITQLGNALGAAAPFVSAIKGNQVSTNAAGQPTTQVANATTQQGQTVTSLQNGQVVSGMSNMTLVLIGVGVLVLIGGAVMLAKK